MENMSVLNTDNFSPLARRALVLSLFDGLRDGQSFVLVTEEDPQPLCEQLDSLAAPNLHWEYLKKGGGNWSLRIAKLTQAQMAVSSTGGCCGSCGGSGHG